VPVALPVSQVELVPGVGVGGGLHWALLSLDATGLTLQVSRAAAWQRSRQG